MEQTAAHLVDHVLPHVPVRRWVLIGVMSLPIPLHLRGQVGLQPDETDSSAITLIQRFGSAANLNLHLHCRVLDGVYRRGAGGTPEFVEAPRQPTKRCRRCCTRSSPD